MGIDYGRGLSNIDKNTGIRFGCISVNSLSSWVIGEAEPIYPDCVETECPECGHSFETSVLCPDDNQTCPECEHEYRDRSLDMLEPCGWDYSPNDSEYSTDHSESLNCVFILKSPFYTFGPYCSPCAPGAIDLDNADDDHDQDNKAYCFGHDYFEDGKAPYVVYSVLTGEIVTPPQS